MLDFDRQVAIVTGGGRGIGRASAIALARRGAKVLVNDYGGAPDTMTPGSIDLAQSVVDEIAANGGTAIADGTAVGTSGAATAIVDRALAAFGKVDILVNNAGGSGSINPLTADSDEAAEGVIRSNLLGSFHLLRRVWPIMRDQNYGRIVNMASSAALGLSGTFAYASAKGGVIGMTNVAAVEGREHGIVVNVVLPSAFTRGAALMEKDHDMTWYKPYTPELVGEGVVFLCSRACVTTGEMYRIGGGMFSRYAITGNTGLQDWQLTAEKIVTQIDSARDMAGAVVLTDTMMDIERAF